MTTQTNLKETAKQQAADLAADARDGIQREASRRVDDAQHMAADTMQEAADAAAAASAQFDANSIQAEAVRKVADSIDNMANQVRATDLETIVRDVSNFARRNPLIFIGAAAAAGFAATRFLKAQGNQGVIAGQRYNDDPWSRPAPSANVPANDDHRTVLSELNGDRHA